MNNSTRVIINTIAQYSRTIISAIISLYTSRIILQYLGVSDYGINDVVAGLIAMFLFIDYSLSQTIQRYISYAHGKGDITGSIKIFNNSVINQFVIASFLCIILLLFTNPLFNNILNISEDRQEAALYIYYFMIVSLFVNLMITPYLAIIIARENIVYSSFVQLVDSFIKIPIALSLCWISYDKLIWYGLCNLLVVILNFILYYVYCKRKYIECQNFKISSYDKVLFGKMFSFTGWTLYGTACVVGRSRGLAIVINNFFTTSMNGAMGIGSQICSQLSFLSTSLTTAMRPQIMKAEGAGDRVKMIKLTEICCKSSLFLLSLISIPAVIEMDNIMSIWLVNVPPYAVFFAKAWIISQWIDQFTVGLSIANAAVGDVKYYNIITNTIKIFALPVIFIFLFQGYPVEYSMYIYIIIELICSITRLLYMKHSINLNIMQFLKKVILPLILPILITYLCCRFYNMYSVEYFCLFNFIVSFVILSFTTYILGINSDERKLINGNILKIYHKLSK